MELTKEDVLALRLEVAELRREMAELRREIAARGLPVVQSVTATTPRENEDKVSTDQIVTEWIEGEEAWKAKEKTT